METRGALPGERLDDLLRRQVLVARKQERGDPHALGRRLDAPPFELGLDAVAVIVVVHEAAIYASAEIASNTADLRAGATRPAR